MTYAHRSFLTWIAALGISIGINAYTLSHALAAPVILYADILSGPNTGGENNSGAYLSIFGKGFGDSSGLGTKTKVFIGGVEVAAYKYMGKSNGRTDVQQISVQPGPGVSGGAIAVEVEGIRSNTDHSFTVRASDIFFVALNGDNATGEIGNINKPFRTPGTVVGRSDFDFGDILVVRGGEWDFSPNSTFVKIRHGSTGLTDVVLMAYPGEEVILKQEISFYAGDAGQNRGVTISGFDRRGGSQSLGNSENTRFINNEVTGMWGDGGGTGAISGKGSGLAILGNEVHDNGYTKLYHAIYIDDGSGLHPNGVEIAYNHIRHQTGGRGIQIYHAEGLISGVNIHDNIIHHTDRTGILLGNQSGAGCLVYNNLVYQTGLEDSSYSISPVSGEKWYAGGIALNSEFLEVRIFHNSVFGSYGNDPNGYAIGLKSAKSVELRNNIFHAPPTEETFHQWTGVVSAAITASHNLYYGGSVAAPSWDTHPLTADPLFVDPNAASPDFRLQSGSPAKDAGTQTSVTLDLDGNPRPQGSAADVGAFEFCTPGSCLAGSSAIADTVAPAKPAGLTVL